MSYHIKRDGSWICGLDKQFHFIAKRDGCITFSDAHKSKLNHCCNKCKERYVDIMNKMKNPPAPVKGSYYHNLAVISIK